MSGVVMICGFVDLFCDKAVCGSVGSVFWLLCCVGMGEDEIIVWVW